MDLDDDIDEGSLVERAVLSLAERTNILNTQVQFCVDYMDEKGLLDNHCFTFPDGETVHATQILEGDDEL